MKIRYLIILTTLAFVGFSISAEAHPCKHHPSDPDHPHCQDGPKGNPGSESNDKVFPAKVVFDDASGDTVMSDGRDYIDSVNATAEVPQEGTPPGQFLMWQGDSKNFSSTLFLDFGDALNCDEDDDMEGCVQDATGETVTCPILRGDRLTAGWCSGFKPVTLNFRHTVDETGAPSQFILDMTAGEPFDGEAYGAEMRFSAERNSKSWQLRFNKQCDPDEIAGDFLKIARYNSPADDEPLNDRWYISTGEGMKTACLTKDGNGNTTMFVGLFDMQFGYTICILANPDSGDGVCLE